MFTNICCVCFVLRTICISDREDKRLISDYLCDAWQCTEDQVELVDKHLETRKDPIHCEFKPLRGGIYKQWVKTKWWAWAGESWEYILSFSFGCGVPPSGMGNIFTDLDISLFPLFPLVTMHDDMPASIGQTNNPPTQSYTDADQLVGNFKSLWPWSTIDNFDVATISEWDIGNIYLRGQFTAFKTSPKMDKIWMKYPPLSSPEKLHTLGHGPLDEFDYSVFYSNSLKNDIDWILIPRLLGADKFGVNKIISNGHKMFYVPNDMRRRDITILLDDRFTPKSQAGFAPVEAFDPEKWAVPVREVSYSIFTFFPWLLAFLSPFSLSLSLSLSSSCLSKEPRPKHPSIPPLLSFPPTLLPFLSLRSIFPFSFPRDMADPLQTTLAHSSEKVITSIKNQSGNGAFKKRRDVLY